MIVFSVLITTKNRLTDLKYTLNSLQSILSRQDVECIICDDASTDGTAAFIKKEYPLIQLIENKKSKGLIENRNLMLNTTKAKYAISLDDDSNFLSNNPLETIKNYFEKNKECAVIACRIFWGRTKPEKTETSLKTGIVKSFVGCGHVWNIEIWKSIDNYPNWFIFYGEEDYAAYTIFKNKKEVHYVPNVLIHHRVEVKKRKNNTDYYVRLRRSLRAGWYLYFIFYPLKLIPRKFFYTLWIQLKLKVFKGDLKALGAIILALFDVLINTPKYFNNKRLTLKEFRAFEALEETKIYWKPNE